MPVSCHFSFVKALVLSRLLGQLRQDNADITLMIQGDMLAYRAPGEPPQLGLPDV